MTFGAWALFCLTETVLCLEPGPAVLLVVGLGVTRGARVGRRAALGVIAANAVYFALSASGLVALLQLSEGMFRGVRLAGAAYLLLLGARMIVRTLRTPAAGRPAAPGPGAGRALWQGFVAQGANPGLLVYFTAILPQFVDASSPMAPQIGVLALSSFAIELAVLAAYAQLSGGAGRRAAPRLRVGLERLGGGLLIAAGLRLAALRRAAGT